MRHLIHWRENKRISFKSSIHVWLSSITARPTVSSTSLLTFHLETPTAPIFCLEILFCIVPFLLHLCLCLIAIILLLPLRYSCFRSGIHSNSCYFYCQRFYAASNKDSILTPSSGRVQSRPFHNQRRSCRISHAVI